MLVILIVTFTVISVTFIAATMIALKMEHNMYKKKGGHLSYNDWKIKMYGDGENE